MLHCLRRLVVEKAQVWDGVAGDGCPVYLGPKCLPSVRRRLSSACAGRRLGMQEYNCGAISRTDCPCIHLSSQNFTVCPSPRDVVVEAKKKARSFAMNWRSRPLQAWCSSVLSSHY